jgi:Raf kinase inhibitor-like YbhB/YbcL family protein
MSQKTLCVRRAIGGIGIVAVFAAAAPAQTPSRIEVSSPTLKEGETIPRQYTPDGRNDSPPLAWSSVPASAKSLAVVCEDPDAGNPPPFVHWVIYNIPAGAKGLPEALPIDPAAKMPSDLAGAVQGTNGFRRTIYRGPAPPPGKPHHYHFVVYALDAPVQAKAGQPPLARAELMEAIKGHVVGQGELVAVYERQGSAEPEQAQPSGRGRGRGRN